MGFFLVNDELEIIDNKNIEFAEFEIEFLTFTGAYSINEIGVEVRDRSIEDFKARVFFKEFVTDGLDEVGFAEAGTTVEEEWIIACAWGIDDAFSGRNG